MKKKKKKVFDAYMLDFLILQVMFSAAIKTYLEVLETPEKASP